MKTVINSLSLVITAILLVASASNAGAAYQTLFTDTNPGKDRPSQSFLITESQTLELVSGIIQQDTVVRVERGTTAVGLEEPVFRPFLNHNTTPFVLTGPATITLTTAGANRISFLTFKIDPTPFSPDKTIIIPQGQGAVISVQCSTNLIDWSDKWVMGYTNVPSALFFRIGVDRVIGEE